VPPIGIWYRVWTATPGWIPTHDAPSGAIVLAALLGAWAVTRLRGARPQWIGMIALAIAPLVPISARAVPFTFTNGRVADANQVNANFAALSGQGLAPTASGNLVDLTQGSVCPESAQGTVVNNLVDSTGIGSTFSIPAGQTFVLENVSTSIAAGAASANHAISFRVFRFTPAGGGQIDVANITLNSQGAGSATIPFGAGSPFAAGTNLCVFAQDLGTFAFVTPFSTSAHGFLTTQ
jgi:hypothetical protein